MTRFVVQSKKIPDRYVGIPKGGFAGSKRRLVPFHQARIFTREQDTAAAVRWAKGIVVEVEVWKA